MVTSKKVKLLCEDKSSFCGQVSEEQKCESDLAKLICRKSCNHCKCEDADSGFCKADDICGSTEGKLLCAKKCNACEFTMVDDEEPPKGPKEAELEKTKEDPEKEAKEKAEEEAKKAKEQEKEEADKAKEQVKEDAKKAKEIEEAEEKAREKEKEDAKKAKEKEDADKEKEKEKEEKKPKEKEEQDKGKEEMEPEPEDKNKDDEKNKDEKPEPKSAEDCLKYHNKFRENHEDTPAMEWDETMAKGAEEYAKKLAETEEFKHSDRKDRNDAGENLVFRSGKFDNTACEFAVASWYKEINDFDFNTKKGAGTGHFTQVVWKKSTKLGCGVGKKGNREYIVCRYVEAGNMMGEYKTQVGDLKKDVTMDVIQTQIKDAGVNGKRRNHVSKLLRKPVIL